MLQRMLEKTRWQIALIAAYVFAADTVGALSVLREYERLGIALATWQPFVWEYSSGIVTIALLPLILLLDSRFPLRATSLKISLPVHLLATIPFSLLHVAGMVGIRKLVYWSQNLHYDFGDLWAEMFYEYRKDFLTYFFILFVFYAFRYFRERASGASYEASADDSGALSFTVRHRGLERVVDADEIEWVEAAGNYVLLHVGPNSHPLRDTMRNLEDQLGDRFIRVHRSAIVNRDRVEARSSAGGSRRAVVLSSGKVVPCGRSYQAQLSRLLSA